jgi:hypothetical protein
MPKKKHINKITNISPILNNKCDLETIIKNNCYVKNCKSNKNKDIHSLSSLIDIELSQSDCIKIGVGLENVLKDYIINQCPFLQDIKQPNKKGVKEKDHLFMDEDKKIIYYAEIKSNLNLDTEKSKATIDKCLHNKEELEKKYQSYEIKMFLISARHYKKDIIPNCINNKYTSIKDNLTGLNEYFSELSISKQFNEEQEYKAILNLLAKSMFKK